MALRSDIRKLVNRVSLPVFRLRNSNKEKFECPVCKYYGPFMDVKPATGMRKHAKCPNCDALERHRLQYLVLNRLLLDLHAEELKILHFAPEAFFRHFFAERFGQYHTADLDMEDVDFNVDLQALPFEDAAYDFVFASHVLEHIPNDKKAISEIRRILKPNGIAILPLPLVAETTVEYPEANPKEFYHIRAPGYDYFDRFEPYFSRVEKVYSYSLPAIHQLFIYEDRSQWPTEECPLRPSMQGEKHPDIVPVCYV